MTITDPHIRHQAAILALDQQAATARKATPGPWRAGGTPFHPWELIIAPDYPLIEMDTNERGAADAEFIAANHPTAALTSVEGRRRILERHPPDPEFEGPACGHPGCFAVGANWPCADWLDAAAGLEDRP